MKIEIIENSEFRVVVSAKIFPRKYAKDPNVHLDTSNIMDFLGENNITFERCTKEVVLNNYSKKPRLEGEWIFKKAPFREELAKSIKSKGEKLAEEYLISSNLDNNESESNNEKPTTKRRRRRRPSTSKEKD
tara:strand:+ start:1412 stop:1807 length:396 start_codon:yes stop_codon:yes gene_type:complete